MIHWLAAGPRPTLRGNRLAKASRVEAHSIEIHRPSPTRPAMHGSGDRLHASSGVAAAAHHRAPHLPKAQAGADQALIPGMKQILIGYQMIGILINFQAMG